MNPYIPDILPLSLSDWKKIRSESNAEAEGKRNSLADLDWQKMSNQIGEARSRLSLYDGMLSTLPNAAVLLSPITANEAVLSSRIEGTVATYEEVLQQDAGIEQTENKFNDIEEIKNYRSALICAEEELEKRNISLSLIKTMHQMLLQGVRGKNKSPGEFRKDQNWIGKQGCKIEEARFIPPSPLILDDVLSNWVKYVSSDHDDPIMQSAIVHAQFEIIHPFKDGNGRIGRILIPLLLYQRKALSRPMFYLSEEFEADDQRYKDRLLSITRDGNWQGWIDYFIQAVINQADRNMAKVRSLMELYDSLKSQFNNATHSQYAAFALDSFFIRPIINSSDFMKFSQISTRATANKMLKQLLERGLIRQLKEGSGTKPGIYVLPKLVNIAEGKDVFKA